MTPAPLPIGTTADGDSLALPDDAVSQGFAILARRRSGKSTLAGVMEETFCERRDPWVCLDPVAAHWGIKYKDRKGQPGAPSGHDVLIVGGKYGDVPLSEHAGAQLAEVIVDTNISCVIDLGEATMNVQQKFVADFATELLRINETPRHVFLEEAHTFVPQQLTWDNQKLVLGALSKMITMGGGKGLGYTLITQRAAAVAKSVLEQIDNLFVLRMSGPRDLRAVQDWFEHNVGDPDEMKWILGTLRAFRPGEAWWLSDAALQRLEVRQRQTYHAGRTPKRGEKPVSVQRVELPRVIERFRKAAESRQMAVEEERDLKAETVRLRRELKAARKEGRASPPPEPSAAQVERAVGRATKGLRAEHERDLRAAAIKQDRLERVVKDVAGTLVTVAERMEKALNGRTNDGATKNRLDEGSGRRSAVRAGEDRPPATSRVVERERRHDTEARQGSERAAGAGAAVVDAADLDGPPGLSRPQQAILDALAELEAVGLAAPRKEPVAVLAGASPASSSYTNNLGRLRTLGLIEYPQSGTVALAPEGRGRAAPADAPPTLDELHDRWCGLLSGPQATIARALIDSYPDDIDRTDLAELAKASAISSSYGNNLGRLRTLRLIDYPAPGRVVATTLLFPEGLGGTSS